MSHHKLIDTITAQLFKAEERRLDTALHKINRANREAGAATDGFFYNGQFYRPLTGQLLVAGKGHPKAMLHPSLHGPMDGFLADKKRVEDERKFTYQTLMNLLTPCKCEQDIRSTLPECLKSFLPEEIATLERHTTAAFTIENNPRALRQYEKILPTIEAYSVSQLLY